MGLAGMGTFLLEGLAAFSLMSRPVVLGPSASVLPLLVPAVSQAPPRPALVDEHFQSSRNVGFHRLCGVCMNGEVGTLPGLPG